MDPFIKTFTGDGTDFSATYEAEKWLQERGFSIGSMERDAPRGILLGDINISKWRNLDHLERVSLDGTAETPGSSPRTGPVVIRLTTERAIRAAQS